MRTNKAHINVRRRWLRARPWRLLAQQQSYHERFFVAPTRERRESLEQEVGEQFLRLRVQEGVARWAADSEKAASWLRKSGNEKWFHAEGLMTALRILLANAPPVLRRRQEVARGAAASSSLFSPLEGLDILVAVGHFDQHPGYSLPVLSRSPAKWAKGLLTVPYYHAYFDSGRRSILQLPKLMAATGRSQQWWGRLDRVIWRGALNRWFTHCGCEDQAKKRRKGRSGKRRRRGGRRRGWTPNPGTASTCQCHILELTTENWKLYPRARAVWLSRQRPEDLDCSFTTAPGWEQDLEVELMLPPDLRPSSLSPEQRSPVPPEGYLEYRYALALPGASPDVRSVRYLWPLFAGNLLLLPHLPFRGVWSRRALRAWEHYLPVREDLLDLPEKLAWARKHPEKAERIAFAGLRFAETHLTATQTLRYLYELLLAYRNRYSSLSPPLPSSS